MQPAKSRKRLLPLALTAMILAVVVAVAQGKKQPDSVPSDIGTFDKKAAEKAYKKPYSPYVGRNDPTRPLFGDTHLHTIYSFDAGAFGCRLGP